MIDDTEFRHFRYLLTIAQTGGFRAAAKQLHTSQSSLSKQAREFQDRTGLHLFERTRMGRTRLTATGHAFVPIAEGLLKARADAIALLLEIQSGSHSIFRIGCSPFADRAVFECACSIYRQLWKRGVIRPSNGHSKDLIAQLKAGVLDVLVLPLPVSDPLVYAETLKSDRMVACLRRDHPLATCSMIDTKSFGLHLGVIEDPELNPDGHRRLVQLLAGVGISLADCSRANHPVEIMSLVRDGYGLALMREGSITDHSLTSRTITGVDWTVDTALALRSAEQSQLVLRLLKELRQRYRQSQTKKPAGSEYRQPHQLSLIDDDATGADSSRGSGDRYDLLDTHARQP